MRYVDHRLRGTYGYIKKQRVFEAVKTVILFAMALGIFFIGLYTLHTKKSLWSVLAVLALLPACRSLVGTIMFFRFSSLLPAEYEKYSSCIGDIPAIYENILTTSDKTYYLPVICCGSGSVIAYAKGYKNGTKNITAHLEDVMKKAGYNVTVKIFEDEDAFISRCRQLSVRSADDMKKEQGILDTIKAVSL